jgi:hypothetical protein
MDKAEWGRDGNPSYPRSNMVWLQYIRESQSGKIVFGCYQDSIQNQEVSIWFHARSAQWNIVSHWLLWTDVFEGGSWTRFRSILHLVSSRWLCASASRKLEGLESIPSIQLHRCWSSLVGHRESLKLLPLILNTFYRYYMYSQVLDTSL